MTVIVAAKAQVGKKTIVVIGADSAVTGGDGSRFVGLTNTSKLIKFPNFVVGISGIGPIEEILLNIRKKRGVNQLYLSNRGEVKEFGRGVLSKLKSELLASPLGEKLDKETNSQIGDLIVATPTSLYLVCTDFTVFEYENAFITTGAGEDLAKGALEILYNTAKKTESELVEVVRKSIEVACKHSVYCHPPVEVMVVK